MKTSKPGGRRLAVTSTVVISAALTFAFVAAAGSAGAQTTYTGAATLTGNQTSMVANGNYIVQNNEWDSTAPESITTDGNADFKVATSSIDNNGGAPGGYPSVYMGCHWGLCSTNQNGMPRQVSTFSEGSSGNPTTSVSTTQLAYSGAVAAPLTRSARRTRAGSSGPSPSTTPVRWPTQAGSSRGPTPTARP